MSACAAATPGVFSRQWRVTWTSIAPHQRDVLGEILSCAAIGSPDTVKRTLKAFIEQTGADELMITSQIFDHSARLRSYEITADIRA